MADVAERVKRIIADFGKFEDGKVTDTASFVDDLELDSLERVELVMAFEEEFGVEIPDDDAEAILSVDAAVKFLEKHVTA